MSECRLFIIGAGRMARAIAGGLVRSGLYRGEEIVALDVSEEAATAFGQATGATGVVAGYEAALAAAPTVLLAVKPQYAAAALADKRQALTGKLVISIMAGISLARLEELTGAARRVRVMPNTPALVGAGCSAYACAPATTAADRELVERVLGAVGGVYEVPESLLDAVTGLSGSGPAYVFAFIQALADGGVAEGLPRDLALELAVRTVRGSAELVLTQKAHPAVLCDQVTSPGGTTARGLEALERGAFRYTVSRAVREAAARSAELGKGSC